MNYSKSFVELENQTFYSKIYSKKYAANNYLKDVERVKYDYQQLFELYKNNKDAVFIIDPPYLSTNVKSYKNYWKLKDYLDVLKTLENTSYIYFTSEKSQLIELCSWLFENYKDIKNPFICSKSYKKINNVSSKGKNIDIMIYKKNETKN